MNALATLIWKATLFSAVLLSAACAHKKPEPVVAAATTVTTTIVGPLKAQAERYQAHLKRAQADLTYLLDTREEEVKRQRANVDRILMRWTLAGNKPARTLYDDLGKAPSVSAVDVMKLASGKLTIGSAKKKAEKTEASSIKSLEEIMKLANLTKEMSALDRLKYYGKVGARFKDAMTKDDQTKAEADTSADAAADAAQGAAPTAPGATSCDPKNDPNECELTRETDEPLK